MNSHQKASSLLTIFLVEDSKKIPGAKLQVELSDVSIILLSYIIPLAPKPS